MNFLMVALGGALGAMARYAISLAPIEHSFPIATFITNLLGAFFIGFIAGISEKREVSPYAVLFLKTGFCGGFTTFSTFSLESVTLLSDGCYVIGTSYAVLSLVCCIAGAAAGQAFARNIA